MLTTRTTRMLRALLRGLLLALVSITLTVLALELALRLFAPQALLHDPDAFIPDQELGARLSPGFADRVVTTEFTSIWIINEKGYRGPVAADPRTATKRIVALGDSFTFGYGVEETEGWPYLLEGRLDAAGGGGDAVEVVNLGVGGYGTWQEAIWLERNWDDLRPDLVVLGFYVGNDPEDNARTVLDAEPEGGAASPGAPAPPPRTERLKRWLGSRLHLYTFVSTRADELLVRLGLRRLVYPFEIDLLLTTESEPVRRGWAATGKALHRLGALCREKGAQLVVMLIPMKHQVSDAVWSRLLHRYPVDGWSLDRLRPQRIAGELCAKEGIEVFDLHEGLTTAAIQIGGDGRVFYWPRDQHFNPAGHLQTAKLLAEYLSRAPAPR